MIGPIVHSTHTYTPDYCQGKYCAGCGSFIGSLDAGIGGPCAMDRRAVAVVADEPVVAGPNWFEFNRSAG